MIFEHEIPTGAKLYFGKIAKLKRDIEYIASEILTKSEFEEILTSNFSFSQHQSIDNERELINLNNEKNQSITLRADSTLDVVRIINKRLGRSTTHKKWFYIQPVFKYPTTEIYQIGAEWIDNTNLEDILNILIKLLLEFKDKFNYNLPTLQISNNHIAKIISKELNIDFEFFKTQNFEKLLKIDNSWLRELIYVQSVEDLKKVIEVVPNSIKDELISIQNIVEKINYENIVISPLYYSHNSYYDGVIFRFIDENDVIVAGGNYRDNDIKSSGFAIYTDNLIEKIL